MPGAPQTHLRHAADASQTQPRDVPDASLQRAPGPSLLEGRLWRERRRAILELPWRHPKDIPQWTYPRRLLRLYALLLLIRLLFSVAFCLISSHIKSLTICRLLTFDLIRVRQGGHTSVTHQRTSADRRAQIIPISHGLGGAAVLRFDIVQYADVKKSIAPKDIPQRRAFTPMPPQGRRAPEKTLWDFPGARSADPLGSPRRANNPTCPLGAAHT
jgi:hypothetical protein